MRPGFRPPGALQECYRRVSYGADGEMATIEDANNNITTYGYDGWNRQTLTTFPDTTFEQLTLDENANVTIRQNRAQQQLTYTYDALNLMRTKVSPSPALTTTWTYLLDGRVNVLSDTATNSINYGYDTAGRLNQVVNHINGFGANRTVNYTLDANGNRTQLKWPLCVHAPSRRKRTGAFLASRASPEYRRASVLAPGPRSCRRG